MMLRDRMSLEQMAAARCLRVCNSCSEDVLAAPIVGKKFHAPEIVRVKGVAVFQ